MKIRALGWSVSLAAFLFLVVLAVAGETRTWGRNRRSAAAPGEVAAIEPGSDRFGVMAVPADPRSPQALRDLGLGWVRFSSRMGEPSRAAREARTFRRVSGLGFKMWLTISHRDRANAVTDGTVGWDGTPRGGFEPRDIERYRALVRETIRPLVEDLRRQGKDPAEWLVVQVENEVLPHDVRPPDRPQRFWHGTSDGYLRSLAAAYDAVKSVDSGVPVACFGFSSEMLAEFVSEERPRIVSWGERVLRDGRFDHADVHLYNRIDEIPAKIAWVRARTDRPVSATEVGGPDPAAGGDPSDDAALAADLPIRVRAVLDAGVERAFWVLLVETTGADERFRKMGLIDARWRRRPAFEAYRLLIAGR